MDFRLNKEQLLIQKAAREFARKKILPLAESFEEEGFSPRPLIEEMAKIDLLGLLVPEEMGGTAFDMVSYLLALEEIAAADAGVALSFSTTSGIANLLVSFGDHDQKAAYLPDLISGKSIGAFCLREAGAGSELQEMETTANPSNAGWTLVGEKEFVINGSIADLFLVYALIDGAANEPGVFLVQRNARDLSVKRIVNSMGIRSSAMAEIGLKRVNVPRNSVLRKNGAAKELVGTRLDDERIEASAIANGLSRSAMEMAVSYSRQRVQFGRPICEFQAISNRLADMDIFVNASRWLTYQAGFLRDQRAQFTREAAQAKVFASEVAYKVCHSAVQIYGGHGFVKEYPIERLYRDQRILEIYADTNEINRNTIASRLVKS